MSSTLPARRPRAHVNPPVPKTRLALMIALIAENPGMTGGEAYTAISGPQGKYPLKRFKPVSEGGLGDKYRPEIAEGMFLRLAEQWAPELLREARSICSTRLAEASGTAVETVIALARGDFSRFRKQVVGAEGVVLENADPQAAKVSLDAAGMILGATGVTTRPGAGPSTQVLVQGGEGGAQHVTVFGALSRLGDRAQQAQQAGRPARARRVAAEVVDAQPDGPDTAGAAENAATEPQGAPESVPGPTG
jgi:hypothetical protein